MFYIIYPFENFIKKKLLLKYKWNNKLFKLQPVELGHTPYPDMRDSSQTYVLLSDDVEQISARPRGHSANIVGLWCDVITLCDCTIVDILVDFV